MQLVKLKCSVLMFLIQIITRSNINVKTMLVLDVGSPYYWGSQHYGGVNKLEQRLAAKFKKKERKEFKTQNVLILFSLFISVLFLYSL